MGFHYWTACPQIIAFLSFQPILVNSWLWQLLRIQSAVTAAGEKGCSQQKLSSPLFLPPAGRPADHLQARVCMQQMSLRAQCGDNKKQPTLHLSCITARPSKLPAFAFLSAAILGSHPKILQICISDSQFDRPSWIDLLYEFKKGNWSKKSYNKRIVKPDYHIIFFGQFPKE